MLKEITIKVPEKFLTLWDTKEEAIEEIRKLFILDLVWRKRISQNKGAELLKMSYTDFINLVDKYNIPNICKYK